MPMSNPKIVVGGVPSVGKTSICGYLARKFDIDMVLSGDYLREFLRGAVEDDKRYEILKTSVYDAWKRFGLRTKENIVKGYVEQGKVMSVGLNAVIERAIKNDEKLIMETLYFLPENFPSLRDESVIPVYIHVSSPERYREMILERERFTHPGQPGDRLAAQMDAYQAIAEYTLELCRKGGVKTFDNLDYLKTREEITQFVASRIRA